MAGSTAEPKADKTALEQLNIQEWVKGLAAIPAQDFSLEAVQNYIVRHAVRPDTIENIAISPKEATPAT
jgi:hypothetical protein